LERALKGQIASTPKVQAKDSIKKGGKRKKSTPEVKKSTPEAKKSTPEAKKSTLVATNSNVVIEVASILEDVETSTIIFSSHFLLHFIMCLQLSEGRDYYFQGQLQKNPIVDFIIAEYPDGLRVRGVSDPPTQIPHWNRKIPNFLAYMISFATAYLHEDGAFLLFYPDGSNIRRDIFGFFKNYNFKIKDEWTIINCLHLTNLVNPNKNVSVLHSLKLPSSLHSVGEFLLNYHLIISKYILLTLSILFCKP
jgi:hypothetical protein